MESLTGTWRGEYRISFETEGNLETSYFHFQVRIKDGSEGFEGKFKDLTLQSEDSDLYGFIEDDFISFVRKAKHSEDFVEFLDINLGSDEKLVEFIFNGNWNEEDKSFVGYWEVEVDEEMDSLQSDVITESRTGEWYLSKF